MLLFTRRRRCAFTLVELLVVIGIIVLLISILLPSLARSRRAVQQVQCLTQLRNMGQALNMYVGESKGRLPIQTNSDLPNYNLPSVYDTPAGANVLASLLRYLSAEKRILVCPMAIDVSGVNANFDPAVDSDTNYMSNQAVWDAGAITKVRRSAEVVAFQEGRYRYKYAFMRPRYGGLAAGGRWYRDWSITITPAADRQVPQYMFHHDRGGNFLALDGHAEYRKLDMLKARDFGLRTGLPAAGGWGDENDDSTTRTTAVAYRAEWVQ